MIELVTVSTLPLELRTPIRELLDLSFKGRFTNDDWDHALGGWHAIALTGPRVLAHGAVIGRRIQAGERVYQTGYLEAVATHPRHERQGLGSRIVEELNRIVRRDFEMGALSTGTQGFYTRLGWESWCGPTFVRDGDSLLRTAEEDQGIMVLRFGVSRSVDLQASLVCETRSGDVW